MKAAAEALPQTNARPGVVALLAIAAVAIKGLILFVGIPAYESFFHTEYQADLFPDQYDLLAQNLIDGHGYRFLPETASTTIRTPGFVLVLAGLFFLFGKSLAAIKAFHLVLSSAAAYFTYRLGTGITGSSKAGAAAALLYFFYPGTILADTRGGIETLFTFSIILFLFLLYRAIESKRAIEFAAAGACFGAAMLIKSSAILFPAALLAYLVAAEPRMPAVKTALANFAIFAVAAGLVMSPWIARNAMLTGRFIPTMSVGGLAAFQGAYVAKNQGRGKEHAGLVFEAAAEQNEIARSMGLRFTDKGTPFFPQFYTIQDELTYYGHLGDLVLQDYRQHPSSLLKAVSYNAAAFWIQGRTAKATLYNALLTIPYLGLSIGGMVLALRQHCKIAPLVLFIGAFYVLHLPVIAMARYYVPLVPLLSILASISLLWLGGILRGGAGLHRRRQA